MGRNDVIALGLVSFFGGVLLSTLLIAVVDPPTAFYAGFGSLCSAFVAAFVYFRQTGRRW